MCAGTASALEKSGLYLQGHVGLFRPLSPQFITTHWSSNVHFSGGFGAILNSSALLFTYSNQVFNIKQGIIPDGLDAYAHEIQIDFKRFVGAGDFTPFWQLSAGYTLLRTPPLYKESELIPGMIEQDVLLENAHEKDGLTVGAGVGLQYHISTTSLLFLELHSAITWLKPHPYSQIGARTGLLFQIGSSQN